MAFVYQCARSGGGRENRGRKQEAYARDDEPLRLTNLVTALVHKEKKKTVTKNWELPG